MKKLWIFGLIILFFSSEMYAQDNKVKVKVYKAWVTMVDGTTVKGFLRSADAEGIVLNKSRDLMGADVIEITPTEIDLIKVRSKTKVIAGAVIGFAAGALAGAALNASDGSGSGIDLPELDAIAIVSTSTLGAGIGAIAGTGRKEIPINGRLETYIEQLSMIQKYCYLTVSDELY